MSRFCWIALVLSLVACSPKLYWAKPGAKPGEFERDVTDCRRALAAERSGGGLAPAQLNPAVGISQVAVEECLGAKGWFLAKKPGNVSSYSQSD